MSRPVDPFEIRSRALAIEAGVDPDSRVPMIGSERTKPAWTNYREAARKEKQAAQQAEAQNLFNPSEQPEQYRDAPLTIVGDHDENTIMQMRNCMSVGRVVAGALCADGHLGYAQPVGAVIAYDRQISISGVGFDIACGNMAVRLDTRYDDIASKASAILADIKKAVSFGVGRTNEERVEHTLFDDNDAWRASGMEDYRQKAKAQLGTVGSGNHYVDLFRDTDGYVWIGVHFGSRGFGHSTATKYLKLAGGQDGMHVPPTVVDEDSSIGEAYLAGMNLAGRYAYAGREWVVERVRKIIGGAVMHTVHNHHNFAWKEKHRGVDCWVVRKGATPAWSGQEGFIGGSMGDDAVIVEGVENNLSTGLLSSTVHGAGRNFGRKQALRTFSRLQMDEWLQRAGVLVSGGDLDESPMAYKRLPEVLAHHGGTIRVTHNLKPFAVAMAGSDEFDPWKD
ncbi:MAG: RtcB family protein [Beijerinckiaceae bacterium]